MGLFDIFKRKRAEFRQTRNMELKFLYECHQCSEGGTMRFEIPLVEDDKHIYTQWAGQSSSPILVKLPLVNMKSDNKSNYIIEKIFDKLDDGSLVSLSDKRWEEIRLPIKCPRCTKESTFILGVGLISNTEGRVLVQKVTSLEVYSLPIVLLRSDELGNFSIVTFLNPVPEPNKASEMATSEIQEYKAECFLESEAKIVQKRAAEIFAESDTAIQSNPNDVEAYYKRALAYMLEDDNRSAFKALSRAIELDHDYTPAITKRGIIYGIERKFNLAMKDFNRAIELDPGYSPAYLNRGICHYEMGHTDLALNDLNITLEISSESELLKQAKQYSALCRAANSLPECDKGRAYIEKGKYDQAIVNLTKVTESNPSNAYAYFYLGMAYDNKDKYDLAVTALDKAIQLDPELFGAHNNRGWVYLKKKLYWSAIADFTQEIRLNPALVAVYLNRANAYHDTGQPGLAIADLKKALGLSSDPEQIEKIKRQIEAIS